MRAIAMVAATAAHSARNRAWWLLVGAFVALVVSHWLGVAPAAIDRLSPKPGVDSVLLAGVLVGLGMAFVARRRASGIDHALRDPATGLMRRAHADDVAVRLLARDEREGASRLALVVFEIADADVIASQYGQPAIEHLLATVAEILHTQCRGADVPFRFDRRVLGVYLTAEGLASAEGFARRIAVLLASQQLDCQGDVLKPVVISKIAMHRVGQTLDALQKQALAPPDGP